MRDTFINTLTELAEQDPRVFLITADVGFGVLTDFAKRFPKQFVNVGIAEQNMTGIATGLALEGRIVFTYSIANFPTLRCLEQIRNNAAYHEANVKIVSIGAGFSYGQCGMSHHATEDLAIMRSMPITVLSPSDKWEAREATKTLLNTAGTCYLRLDKSCAETHINRQETFTVGKARRVLEGDDFSIIATGGILQEAIIAAKQLAKKNIYCRVVSMHSINPIDKAEIIDCAKNTGGIITLEEHTITGGLGSAVAEVCLDAGVMPKNFKRIGLDRCFSSIVGDQAYLRTHYHMDFSAILDVIKTQLNLVG